MNLTPPSEPLRLIDGTPYRGYMTQIEAAGKHTAKLKKPRPDLKLGAGHRVLLHWMDCHLCAPEAEGGKLIHRYMVAAWSPLGCLVSFPATSEELEELR